MIVDNFIPVQGGVAVLVPESLIEEAQSDLVGVTNSKMINIEKLAEMNNNNVDSLIWEVHSAATEITEEDNIVKGDTVIIGILSLANGLYEEVFLDGQCLLVVSATNIVGVVKNA